MDQHNVCHLMCPLMSRDKLFVERTARPCRFPPSLWRWSCRYCGAHTDYRRAITLSLFQTLLRATLVSFSCFSIAVIDPQASIGRAQRSVRVLIIFTTHRSFPDQRGVYNSVSVLQRSIFIYPCVACITERLLPYLDLWRQQQRLF